MKKEFKEKIKKISTKIDTCNASVSWWEKLVLEILNELDLIQSKPATGESEERVLVLKDRLIKLIPRGDFELQVLNELEKEFEEMILNEKKQRKTKKKSPPKRKSL